MPDLDCEDHLNYLKRRPNHTSFSRSVPFELAMAPCKLVFQEFRIWASCVLTRRDGLIIARRDYDYPAAAVKLVVRGRHR